MRFQPRRFVLLALLGIPVGPPELSAQGPPATDIYFATISQRGNQIRLGTLANLTDRPGYDNQPTFTPDGGAILYTSIRGDGQADTYRYDIASGRTTRLTRTTESEYSPTVTPEGKTFSTVRVEADSAQRLWQFALDGSDPRLLLEHVAPVGYHAWGSEHVVGLFVLGTPPTLVLADIRSGDTTTLAHDIGRSLHTVPGRQAVSFVHRESDTEVWIKEVDVATRAIRPLVRPVGENEFYAWTPDGAILMGEGAKLYRWRPGTDQAWHEIVDLGSAGIESISRLAVSPQGDRLAIVASRR
ncbi:MAG: hypothetical protein GTN78_24265 [Gemmatimonadales bacterium]|nr:hypothetical protein [Gemmatimonadales bacterium]NIN12042.1 hypothetical protein [Gemmatimonadales bacterium]NIR03277.1 hypothetical protein [Gemmatimonadales bacterium]NIS66957.1 hypothetical protein [Gemmatimonadales bacterium]